MSFGLYEYHMETMTAEKRDAEQGTRKSKALCTKNIEEDIKTPCSCDRNCYELLDSDTVMRWRQKLYSHKGIIRQQKLLDLYMATCFTSKYGDKTHLVEGQIFCSKVWYRIVMGISERTYARLRAKVKQRVNNVQESDRGKSGVRGKIAVGFMKHYVSVVGDHNPESGRIMLPTGINVKDVYDRYAKIHGSDIIKKTRFYDLWTENMSHVSNQKDCRMAKCNVCVLARHLLEQSNSEEVTQNIKKDREEHLTRQRKEREHYYLRRAAAIDNPQDKTSIIIDGMDQNKTHIPHFKGYAPPKELEQAAALKTHITGALVHGKASYMYVDMLQWPHDANLTMNCILHALRAQATDNQLTKTLYIQMDNCGRENKNKYVLGMMAVLVARQYVKEVIISFLMVGHTHEDIDAKFSKVSVNLRRRDAKTLPQLLDVIGQAEQQLRNIPIVLGTVFNIRDWLGPHLDSIHNHSQPHAFRIYEDHPGHVGMKYKNWSDEEEWLPREEALNIFLTDGSSQSFPTGCPDVIQPEAGRKQDLTRLSEIIKRVEKYMGQEEIEWWNEFLQSPLTGWPHQGERWYLEDMLPLICPQAINQNPTQIEVSPLDMLMRRERVTPDVHTGPRRRIQRQEQPVNIAAQNGSMVGAMSHNELRVGRILEIRETTVNIALYRGTINGKWTKVEHGQGPVIETLMRASIPNDWIFFLTKNSALPANIRRIFAPHL